MRPDSDGGLQQRDAAVAARRRLIAGFIAMRPTLDDARVHDSACPAVSPRVRRTTGASKDSERPPHVRGDPELRSRDDLRWTCHADSPKLRSGRPAPLA